MSVYIGGLNVITDDQVPSTPPVVRSVFNRRDRAIWLALHLRTGPMALQLSLTSHEDFHPSD